MTGPTIFVVRLVLALSLFAFLGWGLYVLWQDLRRQSRLLNVSQLPTLTLHAVLDGQAQVFRFTQSEVSIGRDPASDCTMENSTISGRHARLTYHHGQWWVEDLNSTNGTFLNGQLVDAPMVLTSGDELRFGQIQMQVSLADHPAAEFER